MAEPEGCAGFKAAGVIFFTREAGQVQHVLLSLEQRKVSVKQLGPAEPGSASKGKVNADVVVFPQGRREKKDGGDPVETAMREYHEETGNFGALTEHLLRFYDEDNAEGGSEGNPASGSASKRQTSVACAESFVMYFGLARMVVIFCEVPAAAYARSLRPLSKADFPTVEAPAKPVAQPAAKPVEGADDKEPPKKRAKKEKEKDPSKAKQSSYVVGRENHLTPVWVSADELRKAVTSSFGGDTGCQSAIKIEVSVCPRQSVDGTGHLGISGGKSSEGGECRQVPFFPLNLSVFRQREARVWLGMPVTGAGADGSESAAPAK